MKKVNVEKFLQDVDLLNEKKAENLAEIEADATEFAVNHHFDEKNTALFVNCAKESANFGLSAEDNAKLNILSNYIEDVEEIADTIEETVSDTNNIATIGEVVNV